ncbi:M23 family metallopeptidase [Ferrigenium kumadai]|uniref:M23 family metallopeptidase n=1 Tax=Ferrigenium kumadai TaxID=1682490 RepID=UPI001BB41091|nr:M23 family metallopeptidase [Ferrigenium kumadai]
MESIHNISIHPPLKGEWKVMRPPGHHPYAVDFIQLDDERKSPHEGSGLRFYVNHIPSKNYFCWNKPVFAPIDGTVIRVGNGWGDHEYTSIWKTVLLWYNATFKFRPKEEDGRLDIRPNAGNYIMIRAKEGYIVFLAHLKNQSIRVAEGALVRRGEIVGMVGNSGNSTMPHLHINLFDQMENPFKAKVLPFVFSDYETLDSNGHWVQTGPALPSAGALVRFHA